MKLNNNLTKSDVRALVHEIGLVVANRSYIN